jgi:hypothetical protein
LPTCTFCSDNAARPVLLWSVERRATVIATVMGERPGWPRAACRNDVGVIGAPTDDGWSCIRNWSFFWAPIWETRQAHHGCRNRGAFNRIRMPRPPDRGRVSDGKARSGRILDRSTARTRITARAGDCDGGDVASLPVNGPVPVSTWSASQRLMSHSTGWPMRAPLSRGPSWVMYGRRPRCKRNLTISEAFGCGHVFGLLSLGGLPLSRCSRHGRWP